MSAGILEIRNGAIAQATPNVLNDFSVTSYMTFTGGTFNNTANSGILHLSNSAQTPVMSTIGAAATTAVTMGSVLEVNGNATLAYSNATIAFANGSYFDSLGGSTVVPSILSGDSVFTNIGATNNPHLIQGDFTLKSNSQKAFLVKTGGHLKVIKTLEIAGYSDPADNTSGSLAMTGGTITATNSIRLKTTNDFKMSGGTFATTNVGAVVNNYTLILTGKMTVTGGFIDLSQDTNGLNLGALSVEGNVSFTGGEYIAKIVGTPTNNVRERNRWISTGTFTTTAAALITPVLTSTTTLPPKVAGAPLKWNVITATGEVPPNTVLPTVGGGFVGMLRPARDEYDLQW